jgi:23S rRNA pseudouridine2605 synthase
MIRMQLNKYLALCGVASRRKANDLIGEGRIAVNDEIVHSLGRIVRAGEDEIRLDGCSLEIPARFRYILLNKPAGTITSVSDGFGRPTVLDLLDAQERLFPVGRLDLDTEGVLLITNDGELAYRLSHPRYEIEKIYHARVAGRMNDVAISRLRKGVEIDPGVLVHGEAEILSQKDTFSMVEIRIHEGRKRQVKRMLKAAGYPVMKLIRVKFAGLTAGRLHPGEWRELTQAEIDGLYQMTGLNESRSDASEYKTHNKTRVNG